LWKKKSFIFYFFQKEEVVSELDN